MEKRQTHRALVFFFRNERFFGGMAWATSGAALGTVLMASEAGPVASLAYSHATQAMVAAAPPAPFPPAATVVMATVLDRATGQPVAAMARVTLQARGAGPPGADEGPLTPRGRLGCA